MTNTNLPELTEVLDETVVKQHGEEFTLFAAVDPETRHLLHASFTGNDVVTTNNWLRQFGWVWNACLS